MSAAHEDLLAFTPDTGRFALYFDGTDVGLSDSDREDIDALFVQPSQVPGGNPTLYFSTRGDFKVAGLTTNAAPAQQHTTATLPLMQRVMSL